MTDQHPPSHRASSPWTYAVLGGLASVPLTVAYNWQTATGSEFSLTFLVVGGLIAGYLARLSGTDAIRAGLGAGLVGGLVGYGWVLPILVDTAESFGAAWSFPLAVPALATLFSAIVFLIAGVAGLLGGVVGGWAARFLGASQGSSTGA